MYTAHFKLSEIPYSISPNPRFIYFTPYHREALEKAKYAVTNKLGLTVIHGTIGSGKTSLARHLYNILSEDKQYNLAFIPSPDFTTKSALLRAILAEFNCPQKRSHSKNLKAFQEFAVQKFSEGSNLVLLLDEAQVLNNQMLETIRHLLNFESDQSKFIQVCLFGQPELAIRIDRKPSLKSRVSMFGSLSSLSLREATELINFRWRTAGGGELPFTQEAIEAIYKYSCGLPREIVKLCNEALTIAFVGEKQEVGADIIERSAEALRIKNTPPQEMDRIRKPKKKPAKEAKKKPIK